MTETAKAEAPPRTCVLVLGMHRSGTSAVTRMINLLGVSLPKDVVGASESNQAGHWEAESLVDINDQMLYEGASSWNDWRPFDPSTALSPERLSSYRVEIQRRIADQFAGEALFVLKDPRISRFAPLYIECLAALGIVAKVVLIWRHPLEVVASLRKRASLNKRGQMPFDYALRLWLRYNIDAEAASRTLERIVISFDSMVNDPEAATDRLRGLLASAVPEGVELDIDAARASVRGELRHQARDAVLVEAKQAVRGWAETAHAAFSALERDGANTAAKSELDGLRATLEDDLRRNGEDLTYLLGGETSIRIELADVMRQRNVIIERTRELEANERALEGMLKGRDALLRTNDALLTQLRGTLSRQRRQHIIDLASALRPDFGDKLPKQLSPWRSLNSEKRKRIRQRREDYLTLLNSPLFDADYYLSKYPDVARRGEDPILHYLTHGSSEGRWPSAAVEPGECAHFFPELSQSEGNLVLRLIALLGPETE